MSARIQALEDRMTQVENTLQTILTRLRMSDPSKDTVVPSPGKSLPPTETHELPNFEYRPLDASRSEFRVLALNNSPEDGDPICCDLVHQSLDFDPMKPPGGRTGADWMKVRRMLTQFGALSYTWGSLSLDSTITIGGHGFKITRNLETALRYMRKSKRLAGQPVNTSYWWIDAICINQRDNTERSQQVSCMTRIYKKAAFVHIWLGEEYDHSAIAMDVIRQLGVNVRRAPGEVEFQYPEVSKEKKDLHRRALLALFKRPWWERVWVRQEMALPRTAKFHCGDSTCQFSEFKLANMVLDLMKERLGLDWSVVGRISQPTLSRAPEASNLPVSQHPSLLLKLENECDSGKNFISFKDALFNARSCKATDPRDKVFASLGLVDPEIHQLAADYSLSLPATYKAAVRRLIAATKSVDVLSACQNPERLHRLASWIPNLVDEWKASPFQPKRREIRASYEKADCVFEDDIDVLRLKGEFLDTVDILSESSARQDDKPEQLDALYSEWKSFVTQLLPASGSDPYKHPIPEDRHYIQHSLSRNDADADWVFFLSLGDTDSNSLRRFKDEDSQAHNGVLNYRMARSLLSFEDFDGKTAECLPVYTQLWKYGAGRRLCISKRGILGLVPDDARVGDSIVVFHGGSFPYIIRECGEHHVLVGEAYLPNHKANITGHLLDQYFSLV